MQHDGSQEVNQPLMGGAAPVVETVADDAGSQSSQRSSTSLLERIRAQRNREAAAAAAAAALSTGGAPVNTTPATIQVPQYSRVPQQSDYFASAPMPTNNGTMGGFFTQAWNNINHSMETGMASLQQERGDIETQDALLAPAARGQYDEENYTIVNYFLTFVRDVYGTFLNLPLWVRVIMVFALLYTAFKLL